MIENAIKSLINDNDVDFVVENARTSNKDEPNVIGVPCERIATGKSAIKCYTRACEGRV